jgi:mRNA interferase RelE/StbE
VSLRVDYDERAISRAAAFLDDPQGMRAVLDAIDRLADDPRPAGSFAYGSPGLRRLRIGYDDFVCSYQDGFIWLSPGDSVMARSGSTCPVSVELTQSQSICRIRSLSQQT